MQGINQRIGGLSMKLSKGAKSRVKMMTSAERKALCKAARLLAESEIITMKRAETLIRFASKGGY
jgi:uncharacterized protein involved in tellurium resistance